MSDTPCDESGARCAWCVCACRHVCVCYGPTGRGTRTGHASGTCAAGTCVVCRRGDVCNVCAVMEQRGDVCAYVGCCHRVCVNAMCDTPGPVRVDCGRAGSIATWM
eukprot:7391535-Prymnesium_polylepis.2